MSIKIRTKNLKDSGIEWIGKIPQDWDIVRAKAFIKRQNSGVWGEEAMGNVNDLPCLRVADFDYTRLGFSKVDTIRNIPHDQHFRILKDKSTLIERSGGGEKQPVGRSIFFESNQKMVCANFIDSIEVQESVAPKYFTYLLSATYSIGLNLKSIKQSTGIQNLDTYSYFSEEFPRPAKNIQEKIVEYLDSQTVRIDRAIDQKHKLIDLLKEKCAAIINQAVTRGLDGDVELVDSGVEWIGKVPKGWKTYKLKFFCDFQSGDGFPDELQGQDTKEIPFFKVSDINGEEKYVIDSNNYVTKEVVRRKCWHMIVAGSILMAKIGAALAKNHRKVARVDCCIDNNMLSVTARPKIIESEYLYWIWKNIDIADFQNISSVPSVNMGMLKEHQYPLPPKSGQIEIAKELDVMFSVIDNTIRRIEKSIELLVEYRTSLISHTVTGKIEV